MDISTFHDSKTYQVGSERLMPQLRKLHFKPKVPKIFNYFIKMNIDMGLYLPHN